MYVDALFRGDVRHTIPTVMSWWPLMVFYRRLGIGHYDNGWYQGKNRKSCSSVMTPLPALSSHGTPYAVPKADTGSHTIEGSSGTSRECGQLFPKETFPVIETIPIQDVLLRPAWDTPFREGYPGQDFECSWGECT